jgi:hypothetical protein
MSDNWKDEEVLKPLKIKCTNSNCKGGQHCYKPTRKQKVEATVGQCRSCEESAPFDWDRLHKIDLHDIDYTIKALKNELIRQHYWTNKIPKKVENYARRKGKRGILSTIERHIRKSVGAPADSFDGRQTPTEDSSNVNAIHFAQHGTASCCRKCIEYWYGIPQNRMLTDYEVLYLSQLGMRFISDRFPLMTDDGEKIPPIRQVDPSVKSKSK